MPKLNDKKKKVLLLSLNNAIDDPRIIKQANILKNKYILDVLSYSDYKDSEINENIFIKPPSLQLRVLRHLLNFFRLYTFSYILLNKNLFKYKNHLLKNNYDLIIANEMETIKFSEETFKNKKLIFDAHEFYPETSKSLFYTFFVNHYYKHLCSVHLKHFDSIITVSGGIKQLYKSFNQNVFTVLNVPNLNNIKITKNNSNQIKLIHHGFASPSRHIADLIIMMDFLSNSYELNLMLIPSNKKYYNYLKKIAKGKNVNFINPVSRKDIVKELNKFDLGVYLLGFDNLNHKYALPNKFFDFIQARVAIAIGPSIEMADLVKKYDLGVISENFKPESLAKEIRKLDKPKINKYKGNVDNLAELFCFEKEWIKYAQIVDLVLRG